MKDYPYIRAWGILLGSMGYYIEGEIARANEDNAPATAIYKDYDGKWQTVQDIKNDVTREIVEKYAKDNPK